MKKFGEIRLAKKKSGKTVGVFAGRINTPEVITYIQKRALSEQETETRICNTILQEAILKILMEKD
jgi:hypothetical protein